MKATGVDIALARKVLQTEAAAILALVDRLDDRFEHAVRLLLDCRGRVIVTLSAHARSGSRGSAS